MDLILLPGKNPTNAGWIQEVAETLKPLFSSTLVQYYKHWEDEDTGLIDLDEEIQQLATLGRDLGKYCIFAKSAGVILALRAMYEKKIQPVKCFFVGAPFPWAISNHQPLEQWLQNYSIPTLFIQQTQDPAMYFDELRKFLEILGVQNQQLREWTGKSHQYRDVEQIKDNVAQFLSGKD